MQRSTEEPVITAAMRMGMTRERVIRRIQTRHLVGRRDPELGWLVDSSSVDAFLSARNVGDAVAVAS
jgi:hypothetical protein